MAESGQIREPLQGIFGEVAGTYEKANRVLTLGFDRRWRRKAAKRAARAGGTRWLDLCSGTGELAENLVRLAPAGTDLVALDFTPAMLIRAKAKPALERAAFVLGEVKRLPFPEASFDLVTISFATRNINSSREALGTAFREIHRVLRAGGRFVTVETSQPKGRLVRVLFHAYVRLVVRRVGERISGSRAGYAYLAATIPRFLGAEELASDLETAGFGDISFERLLGGAAAIHVAVKA